MSPRRRTPQPVTVHEWDLNDDFIVGIYRGATCTLLSEDEARAVVKALERVLAKRTRRKEAAR